MKMDWYNIVLASILFLMFKVDEYLPKRVAIPAMPWMQTSVSA